jgi:predicted transcriptional regulator of viral defense system
MNNMNENNITLGPKALEVLSALSYEGRRIVTREELEKEFSKNLVVRRVLEQLKKKKLMFPITRGVYVFSSIDALPRGRGINPLFIPNYIFPKKNYYIGYTGQYNSWGFTEQVPRWVFVLNTSMNETREIIGVTYKFIKVSPEKMYGIEKRIIDGVEVLLSDKERTLVDVFYYSGTVGCLIEIYEVLYEQVKYNKIDIDKFIKYASMFPNVTVRKKIGYGLELLKMPDQRLMPIIDSVKNTAFNILYESKSRAGKYNNKWRAIINTPPILRDSYNESEEEYLERKRRLTGG